VTFFTSVEPKVMTSTQDVSSLTLNRLSIYLRCLRKLQRQGIDKASSKILAERFHLSAALIRKDLAHFGEFGIRGVGYDVDQLAERIHALLGLDVPRRLVVVGMGSLGSALARYLDFNHDSFEVVAGFDNDPSRVGARVGHLTVRHARELAEVVRETKAELGVLSVPPEAAQANHDTLADAGVRAILNFAPVQLERDPRVRLKNVDFRIYLEELVYFVKQHDVQ
jgi:redox-sensing transcriptional repressor